MTFTGLLLRKLFMFLPVIIISGFASCSLGESDTAVLWTDRPEIVFYAGYFNSSQTQYKVEARYLESPARLLAENESAPDIVAASWLNSASCRTFFKPLDKIMSKNDLDPAFFYPRLLSLGRFDNRQYLLPVNFNIPAIVFTSETGRVTSNPFTIEMEEIRERGKAYNMESNGFYTRIGFSPASNDEFLFIAAILFGASFREASPIAWEPQAIEQAVEWIKEWIAEANTSIQMEEDFASRYFHDPPDKLVNSGRVLYIHMDSSEFFTLPEERRTNLDFRWLAARETIPIDEQSVYYGIHRRTKAGKAAEAFTSWFFRPETQRLLLEEAKSKRINESSFGIAGGFSAMKTVTEQIFPQFYPALLGRMPPESYLLPSNILPRNWITLKERVILPYLRDRIRYATREEVRPLDRRISEWYRLNRE